MREEPFHIGVRKWPRARQQAVIESFRLMREAAKPRGYNVVTGTHIIFSLEGRLMVFLSAFYFIELVAKLLLLTRDCCLYCMNRPSLWELECFVAVAEALHFSTAARRMHICQSPLSRQIQALETKLGVQLLRRKTRTVELTLPGKVFLDDAREILHHLDRASFAAHRRGGGVIELLRLWLLRSLLRPDTLPVLR